MSITAREFRRLAKVIKSNLKDEQHFERGGTTGIYYKAFVRGAGEFELTEMFGSRGRKISTINNVNSVPLGSIYSNDPGHVVIHRGHGIYDRSLKRIILEKFVEDERNFRLSHQ